MDTVAHETVASTDLLAALIDALPELGRVHAPCSATYRLLLDIARREVSRFGSESCRPASFGPFGRLDFPFVTMGATSSINLFDLDELILFAFYWQNRQQYQTAADIGANLGLHSFVMARCGFEVRCYEPDPNHFSLLRKNLKRNNCTNVKAIQAAVSSEQGQEEFVRVLGNTTGSHLAGAKAAPYGPLERFPVTLESIHPILEWADFVKIDVEGHEKEILLATRKEQWLNTDAMVEIGSRDNAFAIFEHMRRQRVNLYAQKKNWKRVETIEDMPYSYRDGSLFMTANERGPWAQ